MFIYDILEELGRDRLRTRSTMQDVESQKLNYKIYRVFPLHDFAYGATRYLYHLGISKSEAEEATDKFFDKGVLFQD